MLCWRKGLFQEVSGSWDQDTALWTPAVRAAQVSEVIFLSWGWSLVRVARQPSPSTQQCVPEASSPTPSSALGAGSFSKFCQSCTWKMDISLSAKEARQLFLCSLTLSRFSSFSCLFIDLFVAYSVLCRYKNLGFLASSDRRVGALCLSEPHMSWLIAFSSYCFWDFFPSASERLSPH